MLAVLPVLFNIQQLSRLISEKSRKKTKKELFGSFFTHTFVLFSFFHNSF